MKDRELASSSITINGKAFDLQKGKGKGQIKQIQIFRPKKSFYGAKF